LTTSESPDPSSFAAAWAAVTDVPDERRTEAWRLADELRRIIELLTLVEAPAEELAQAADAAHAFADRLDDLLPKRTWSYEGFPETAMAGSPAAFFDRSPIIGRSNPLAAPIEVKVAGEGDDLHVEGRARYGAAYEGPPGKLHGGFLAAAFDEVLGMAQTLSGKPGMTGTLKIVYRSPTPLYEELRFRASVDRIEGRKIFVSGTCHAGDTLTAEAEGIFISVDLEKFAEMMRARHAGRAE
jgi:acyl-coenzyme A thioesterase PaaI-like protein